MARIRYLKPDFFTDEDLAELAYQTRLTFAGLWCYADKAGRLEDRPKFLKAMIFPYDDGVDMEAELDLLTKPKKNGRSFIIRYEVNSRKIVQILSWEKHQRPHHTEKPSDLPEIPETIKKQFLTVKAPLDNGSLTGSNGDGKGNGEGKNTVACSDGFIFFWKEYPTRNGRKDRKKEAWEEWKKLSPDQAMEQLVIERLRAQKAHREKILAKKEFTPEFPDACRWLKKRRWEDEIQETTSTPTDSLESLKERTAARAKEMESISPAPCPAGVKPSFLKEGTC